MNCSSLANMCVCAKWIDMRNRHAPNCIDPYLKPIIWDFLFGKGFGLKMRLDVIIAFVCVAVGFLCAGIAGYRIGGHHREITLEEKFHNFLDAAIAKVSTAKTTVVNGAASALHASEDEAASLLRAAADKISK